MQRTNLLDNLISRSSVKKKIISMQQDDLQRVSNICCKINRQTIDGAKISYRFSLTLSTLALPQSVFRDADLRPSTKPSNMVLHVSDFTRHHAQHDYSYYSCNLYYSYDINYYSYFYGKFKTYTLCIWLSINSL